MEGQNSLTVRNSAPARFFCRRYDISTSSLSSARNMSIIILQSKKTFPVSVRGSERDTCNTQEGVHRKVVYCRPIPALYGPYGPDRLFP
jgi:hypothetical protein